ncbi:MAG: tRNA (N6-threonylcarbamoyladenosine(37)-N6)-methyltransferase TrmO [Victivallaceae bacterium]|nr:tRNA (N6-threonylcarbamoyladenosine(37)-N6)-methyltransferase TrmO [Victivallaceae bacterium]
MRFCFLPIGCYASPQKFRFETPRQGAFSASGGVIELVDDPKIIDACRDLAGVERIWVIFCFHLNENWKPFVRPPVAPEKGKISVLATRAPYRPNPIGLSCVKLDGIEGRKLFISQSDLLDGTPILDIKPYIPEVDAFPDAKVAWRDALTPKEFTVRFSANAMEKILFLREAGGPDLENFSKVQLSLDPLNQERKRVAPDGAGGFFIGCRTWRIAFVMQDDRVTVTDVVSHYTPQELADGDDRYGDKALHRAFSTKFKRCL